MGEADEVALAMKEKLWHAMKVSTRADPRSPTSVASQRECTCGVLAEILTWTVILAIVLTSLSQDGKVEDVQALLSASPALLKVGIPDPLHKFMRHFNL